MTVANIITIGCVQLDAMIIKMRACKQLSSYKYQLTGKFL